MFKILLILATCEMVKSKQVCLDIPENGTIEHFTDDMGEGFQIDGPHFAFIDDTAEMRDVLPCSDDLFIIGDSRTSRDPLSSSFTQDLGLDDYDDALNLAKGGWTWHKYMSELRNVTFNRRFLNILDYDGCNYANVASYCFPYEICSFSGQPWIAEEYVKVMSEMAATYSNVELKSSSNWDDTHNRSWTCDGGVAVGLAWKRAGKNFKCSQPLPEGIHMYRTQNVGFLSGECSLGGNYLCFTERRTEPGLFFLIRSLGGPQSRIPEPIDMRLDVFRRTDPRAFEPVSTHMIVIADKIWEYKSRACRKQHNCIPFDLGEILKATTYPNSIDGFHGSLTVYNYLMPRFNRACSARNMSKILIIDEPNKLSFSNVTTRYREIVEMKIATAGSRIIRVGTTDTEKVKLHRLPLYPLTPSHNRTKRDTGTDIAYGICVGGFFVSYCPGTAILASRVDKLEGKMQEITDKFNANFDKQAAFNEYVNGMFSEIDDRLKFDEANIENLQMQIATLRKFATISGIETKVLEYNVALMKEMDQFNGLNFIPDTWGWDGKKCFNVPDDVEISTQHWNFSTMSPPHFDHLDGGSMSDHAEEVALYVVMAIIGLVITIAIIVGVCYFCKG